MSAVDEVADEAEDARDEVRSWVRPLARWGYIANGFVYVLVGILALRAAIGPREANISRRDALVALVAEPFGQVLLTLIGIGVFGYSLGHLMMATRSEEQSEREGVIQWINRGAHAASGLIHLSLAALAFQLVISSYVNIQRGESGAPTDLTSTIMSYPFGRWLIAIAGLVLLGIAFYEFHKAYTARFRKIYDRSQMKLAEREMVTVAGRIGYVARGIVYILIGTFVLQAAAAYDPQEVGGLGQALATLAQQSYGPWLLGLVAAGLVAFGIYGILLGWYREFDL